MRLSVIWSCGWPKRIMVFDCNVIYQNLPTTIRSYCVETPDGYHTIVLNARMSHEMNRRGYDHEVGHILRDDFHSLEDIDEIEARAHEV